MQEPRDTEQLQAERTLNIREKNGFESEQPGALWPGPLGGARRCTPPNPAFGAGGCRGGEKTSSRLFSWSLALVGGFFSTEPPGKLVYLSIMNVILEIEVYLRNI